MDTNILWLVCDLQEKNVVPSLKKALNDISLEKDAAVVAKVFHTFLSSSGYFRNILHSNLLIMHASFNSHHRFFLLC